jgi:hypothetical protein
VRNLTEQDALVKPASKLVNALKSLGGSHDWRRFPSGRSDRRLLTGPPSITNNMDVKFYQMSM